MFIVQLQLFFVSFVPVAMLDCPTCGNSFYRLEPGAKCGLCQMRKPGMTAPELHAINVSFFVYSRKRVLEFQFCYNFTE